MVWYHKRDELEFQDQPILSCIMFYYSNCWLLNDVTLIMLMWCWMFDLSGLLVKGHPGASPSPYHDPLLTSCSLHLKDASISSIWFSYLNLLFCQHDIEISWFIQGHAKSVLECGIWDNLCLGWFKKNKFLTYKTAYGHFSYLFYFAFLLFFSHPLLFASFSFLPGFLILFFPSLPAFLCSLPTPLPLTPLWYWFNTKKEFKIVLDCFVKETMILKTAWGIPFCSLQKDQRTFYMYTWETFLSSVL